MKKVGVLYGGNSVEHKVSINSANEVLANLDKDLFDCYKFFINQKGNFEFEISELQKMDVVFIAMHGEGGEDGSIQGFLKSLNIPFTGPNIYSSAIGMDKFLSRKIWKDLGLPIINQKIIKNSKDLKNEKLPFVLKPKASGSSVGVFIIKDEFEIENAIKTISLQNQEVLMEDYIKGKEFTIGVLNKGSGLEALPVVEIIPKNEFYDYEAKYISDDTKYMVPAEISENLTLEMQKIAILAAKALNINSFSRVDFLIDKNNNPYLLEINTIPGLTSHSLLPKAAKAEGISFKQLLTLMINSSII